MKGKIELYRNNQFEGYLAPINANIYQTLMGVFYIELEMADINDLQLGDEIKLEFNNEMFTFIVTEMNDKLIRAEHKSYILRNYVVIDKFFNTPPTYDTHIEFADIDLNSVLDGFLKPLMQDINFDIENNSSSIELKDIAFSNDNLLSAIQKICDVFNVEFKRHDDYIEFVDRVGVDTDITINAGIESKNIVKMIDTSNIVTRIYPLGSSQNLPDNYYYKNLRISQFNMTTGIHTGNLYLENSEGIAKYGIIEQTVEFPDVKLQSKKGTIDYSGREIIEDLGKEYIYIRSEDFANIDETKVINLTMLIVDGLKMAELPIIKASNSEKKIWISQTLKDGSTLSWLPSSGSFYTIVGYITQTEMNNARQELENKAMQYLEDNSEPKVIYEVNSVYIQEKEFEVGDRLTLHDFKQNIDTQVRVVEIQKDLIKNLYTTLKFANKVEKIPYSFIKEQQEMKERMKEITVNLTDIASTSRQALERHNLLVRNNFYGSENEYVLIGSEARNYALKGLTITPDDGTNGKVTWTAFTFQEISNDSAYNCGSGNQTLSTNVYYIFIRIQKGDYGNTSGNNKLVFSTTKLENTATYNYYPLGMAEFDGTRTKIATSYGFTLIDGNFIKTGTVQADYIRVGSDADTRVSKGEEANQIVQENKNVWDQAAINAQNALSNISDMSSDSKITPVEKINLKREFDIATQEKTNAALIATSIKDNAGNEIPAIATAKNNLITSYNNLNTYVSPLLADMNATSNVDSTILTQKFTDFYEKLDLVYKAIDEYLNVARNFADNVSTTNYTEINGGTIKTGTITADKIVVEGRNFIIKDLQITPTKNKIEWTTFTLQELAEDTTYTVGSASSTYTSTVTYYLIVRINKNDPNNMNSQNILYTSSTLDKGQIGDFTYYPLGTVKFITNEIPIVSIDKGFTKIHGDYIQTGTIDANKITADFTISAG
ncbi:MAG: phage tail spike protein, partial [Defluviitoga tunisiensis]